MEFVASIFKPDFTDEDEKELDELFPHMRTLCICGYYCIAASVLDGPITEKQTGLLDRLKTEEKILDWHARNQVHWSKMDPNSVRPIARSPIPPGQ
jgi:hypothetical protein